MNRILTLAGVLWVACHPALARTPVGALVGDDPGGPAVNGDAFGASMASWEGWLAVGSPREAASRGGALFEDGAVYLYRRGEDGGLALMQKISRAGASETTGDQFGAGVALSNGWLFVAAANDPGFPGRSDPRQGSGDPAFLFAGKVHLYRLDPRSGRFQFHSSLTAPVPASHGGFGARSQASHIAVNAEATLAVIGESDGFEGRRGRFHVYERIGAPLREGAAATGDRWVRVQSIRAPGERVDLYGEGVVFAGDGLVVFGGADLSADRRGGQGFLFVHKVDRLRRRIDPWPTQTIPGAALGPGCGIDGGFFGEQGLDATAAHVAVAEPCADGEAGPFAGRVDIFRVEPGPHPLVFQRAFEGDEGNVYFGGNYSGARSGLAFNRRGDRLLVAQPGFPVGDIDAEGASVNLYALDPLLGWRGGEALTDATDAAFRRFGDGVHIAGDAALVRENNFLDAAAGKLKGRVLVYSLDP